MAVGSDGGSNSADRACGDRSWRRGMGRATTGVAQTAVCARGGGRTEEQRLARCATRLPNWYRRQWVCATGSVMLLGYARVSKVEGQDASLQVAALRTAGCERLFQEAGSGGRWDRPELHRLLDQLRPGDIVVVWKLDRLSRSLKDLLLILERIERAGAGFRSLTEAVDTTGPAGRMMMQMLGAFAE